MDRLRDWALVSLLVLLGMQPAFAAPPCAGDCDASANVTVDELITGIAIALGTADIDDCRSMDTSGEGDVTVDEIVNAVNTGLFGCPSFEGAFFGTVALAAGRGATVDLDVQANGQASALVTISEATSSFARFLGAGAGSPVISVTVNGSVNLDTGAFTLNGSYVENGTTHTASLTGTLPVQAGAQGTLNFQLDSTAFLGTIARGNGPSPTPTPTIGAATPTATAGASGPVDPAMLGTWSGTARNETTGVMKAVRIKIELQGDSVVVTDLGGNLYKTAPAAITMNAPTRTTLAYNTSSNPFIVFNLTLGANQLAGIYSATTVANPPVIDAVGLVLTKEVPLAPDPRLAGTWSGNMSPQTQREVRLRLEIQGENVLVTDLLGDVFVHVPSTITTRVDGMATAITYVCDTGTCGFPNPIVTFNAVLLASGRLVGAYRDDSFGGGASIQVFFNLGKE